LPQSGFLPAAVCGGNHRCGAIRRETLRPSTTPGTARGRKLLFALLARNSQRATAFFRLPANRVVELGMQVEL